MSWTTKMPGGIRNVHSRLTEGPLDAAGELLEGIPDRSNPLWPADRWPALILNDGLNLGSTGGHGPIPYTVTDHTPGRSVTFTFAAASGMAGWHRLSVESAGEQVLWVHQLEITGMHTSVRAVIVPQHDALLEDLLDAAEATMAGKPLQRKGLSLKVRVLRHLVTLLPKPPAPVPGDRAVR